MPRTWQRKRFCPYNVWRDVMIDWKCELNASRRRSGSGKAGSCCRANNPRPCPHHLTILLLPTMSSSTTTMILLIRPMMNHRLENHAPTTPHVVNIIRRGVARLLEIVPEANKIVCLHNCLYDTHRVLNVHFSWTLWSHSKFLRNLALASRRGCSESRKYCCIKTADCRLCS